MSYLVLVLAGVGELVVVVTLAAVFVRYWIGHRLIMTGTCPSATTS
jgi:hypothetical protein